MGSSRVLTALLLVALAGLGTFLWRFEHATTGRLTSLLGDGKGLAGVWNSTDDSSTPPLSTVSFDVTIAGAPSQGRPRAKVVFLEFSDFECQYCAFYQRDTYPQIVRQYVRSGQVRYVFRQSPVENLHPNAMNAALLSSCAAAQGKFWEVRERLFANQSQLKMPGLFRYAEGLGLDERALRACFDRRQPAGEIAAARADAVRVGFTGVPGFLIGTVGIDGTLHAVRRVYGAQQFTVFQRAIEDVLAGRR